MASESLLKSRLNSFRNAFNGLWQVLKDEINSKIEVFAALVTVGSGFYFEISKVEWLWVISCIGIVLMAEAFNAALEHIVDLDHPQHGEKAGLIKDISAGAVLIVAITAAIIGLLIFIPKIF